MIDKIAFWIATWFGAGLSPVAPGTAGSVAAAPLYWLLWYAAPWAIGPAAIAICIVGVWAAEQVARQRGEEDPQIVVVDEAAGVMLAMWLGAGRSIWFDIAAIALFRLFDIWKPGPIRQLERLRPAGLGIMADDIAAGVLAGVIVRFAGMW